MPHIKIMKFLSKSLVPTVHFCAVSAIADGERAARALSSQFQRRSYQRSFLFNCLSTRIPLVRRGSRIACSESGHKQTIGHAIHPGGSLFNPHHLCSGEISTNCPCWLSIHSSLKVHKNDNFFGFGFDFCTVSLLVMLKYEGFVKNNF